MAETRTLQISLMLPDGKEPKQCTRAELSIAMDAELNAFDRHMQSSLRDQDPLVPSEKALLKTYLAWKILHAEGQTSTKD